RPEIDERSGQLVAQPMAARAEYRRNDILDPREPPQDQAGDGSYGVMPDGGGIVLGPAIQRRQDRRSPAAVEVLELQLQPAVQCADQDRRIDRLVDDAL